MALSVDIPSLRGTRVHLTGIKGTGMAALAEILHHHGVLLSGSDVGERFFTDELLAAIDVVPYVGFAARHLGDAALLVYSAAYGEDNPERQAARNRGIPTASYTEMLGALSLQMPAVAVSGVHGKTSTTAMIGVMIARAGTPATVVVGSGVTDFGGSATLIRGSDFMVAETCEYRRHFLDYNPDIMVVTSVEADHLDYFRDAEDVHAAFVELGRKLPREGTLVYCADSPGAVAVARQLHTERPDLSLLPYGFSATGVGGIRDYRVEAGRHHFTTEDPAGGTDSVQWELAVPGRHMVENAAAAIVTLSVASRPVRREDVAAWHDGLANFSGTRRRSERLGESGGILVMDDYAHHPTAIATTLEGYRDFWRDRRIIVDFMSHTYSRTEGLLEQFVNAFSAADQVILNDIYASARERYNGGLTGAQFAKAVGAVHSDVRYIPDFETAATTIARELRSGDLFVTMGAGDNFRIARRVLEILQEGEHS